MKTVGILPAAFLRICFKFRFCGRQCRLTMRAWLVYIRHTIGYTCALRAAYGGCALYAAAAVALGTVLADTFQFIELASKWTMKVFAYANDYNKCAKRTP